MPLVCICKTTRSDNERFPRGKITGARRHNHDQGFKAQEYGWNFRTLLPWRSHHVLILIKLMITTSNVVTLQIECDLVMLHVRVYICISRGVCENFGGRSFDLEWPVANPISIFSVGKTPCPCKIATCFVSYISSAIYGIALFFVGKRIICQCSLATSGKGIIERRMITCVWRIRFSRVITRQISLFTALFQHAAIYHLWILRSAWSYVSALGEVKKFT